MARALKLNDIQLVLLAAAHQRDDGSLLPPPESLTAERAGISRAVAGLIKRGLAEENEVADPKKVWREHGDHKIGVFITDAGRAAIDGVDREKRADASDGSADEKVEPATLEQNDPAAVDTMRSGTKQALVLTLISRDGGASLEELVAATGWLPHTTRAALTMLRKRGHTVTRTKIDGASRYSAETAA